MSASHKFDVSQSVLIDIVARSNSLSERFSNKFFETSVIPLNEQKESNKRLDRWCQVVASGDCKKFHKRLQWDGLNLDTVRPIISSLPLGDNQLLPNWALTLRKIIQTGTDFQDESKIQNLNFQIPIDSENPLPFEDLLLPAVYTARQKLLNHLGSPVLSPSYLPLELLESEAYSKLERSLLCALVNLCEKSFEFEFNRFRPFGYNILNFFAATEIKLTPKKTHYKAFVQTLLQDGMLGFFQNYPVLARLIATQVDFWVEATGEFLQRLKADLEEIQQVFQPQWESVKDTSILNSQFPIPNFHLGKVIEIKCDLSDPHNRGRSVIAVTFKSGVKLVYKPKDLNIDIAYNQLLEWCNQQGVSLPFKILKILNCKTYGWVEYVEQLPIVDEAAAQRFYQRAGMLLCLLYVLGANDCHYENLIAAGEHLVLVDMETLMHHNARLEDFPEQREFMAANQQILDSVLRIGMLPHWEFNKDNRIAYDLSGLGSIDPQPLPWRVSLWKFVNTDSMHRADETAILSVAKNVPILNGVSLSPNDYVEELVEGFGQMYRFLLEHRQALLADECNIQSQPGTSMQNQSSPLAALRVQQVRFVFRATKVYSVILQNALAPKFLRNGIDRSIELDILARAFLTTENKPDAWAILHSELKAMEQSDIPYFAANSDSDALTVGIEQPIEHFLTKPSYSEAISRLQKLDESDLVQQVAIIRGTFHARVARSLGTEKTEAASMKVADCSTQSPLTDEQLLASARAIAEKIHSHAIKESSGSVYWIGLGYVPSAERFQLQPLDQSLYDGNCGIALFLAALERLTASNQFRYLALGALGYTRRVLQTADAQLTQRLVNKIGIGGAKGLGSIIYSLVKISNFLEETALIKDALRAANLITPEVIASDQKLDVMSGVAGAILGLLALYNETKEQTVLDKAHACGQHLLSAQISVNNSPRTWKTLENKPLTGFSHGSAGIAYALLRLYSVTHDNAFKEAACEGITYERSVFSATAGNWSDFRSLTQQNSQSDYMVSWCHGAAGIALGRLGSLSIFETKEIRQDVEVALKTTQKHGLHSVDHLCCGNLSRCEALLVAAQKLSRPELQEMAQKRAAWVVARAEQTGGYQLFSNLPNHVFSPSFFQGTAGIGYELLRLAYPEVLPSVLLWE